MWVACLIQPQEAHNPTISQTSGCPHKQCESCASKVHFAYTTPLGTRSSRIVSTMPVTQNSIAGCQRSAPGMSRRKHSEVNIKGKTSGVFIRPSSGHHSSFLVFTHTFLKEVCLALQGDKFHPIKRVRCPEQLGVA